MQDQRLVRKAAGGSTGAFQSPAGRAGVSEETVDTDDRTIPPPLNVLRHRIGARREQLRELGTESLSIFGSCARNEQRSGSDIDVIVRLRPGFGYFDLGEIKALLETDFDVPVNPVIESAAANGLDVGERIHVF
jgi:predicted nucleotidyltransferase